MSNRFGPIDHDGLAERVRSELRDAILNGSLRPGERLVESRLASEIQVSRATLRGAIGSLAHEGLVVTVPRKGSYVRRLDAHDAWEVYSLRAALEALAFRTARTRMEPADLETLHEIIQEMDEKAADGDRRALTELDVRFHRTVVELSGNGRLEEAWTRMILQVQVLSERVIGTLYTDLMTVPHRHRQLLDVLTSGTEEQAVNLIQEHIHSVDSRILAQLEDEAGTFKESIDGD